MKCWVAGSPKSTSFFLEDGKSGFVDLKKKLGPIESSYRALLTGALKPFLDYNIRVTELITSNKVIVEQLEGRVKVIGDARKLLTEFHELTTLASINPKVSWCPLSENKACAILGVIDETKG